jgi:hypothetical protein
MKNKILYLLLFICTVAFPQGRKALRGVVKSGGVPVAEVFIINNKTGDETRTDSKGNFNIAARPGDKIAVYSDKTETREFVITEDTFKESPFSVSVEYKAYELDELVVDEKPSNDGYELGQKGRLAAHTPAERKAVAGVKIGPKLNDPTLQGVGINGDGIINIFTGKRKALKRALEMERKEKLIANFKGMYDEVTLTEDFSIPKEYVDGFIYYCIEDKKMATAVETNNAEAAGELMPGLALKYIGTINEK